jgi:hypothetical protein
MRTVLCLVIITMVTGCGTVQPRNHIQSSSWTRYNHKTQYAVEIKSDSQIYLTVKYASYTFLDKTTEQLPTTKALFRQIANDLATARDGVAPSFDDKRFYESTAYNGIMGISTTLVSNDVQFKPTDNNLKRDDAEDPDLAKLRKLKQALEEGLISKEEYEQKKKQLINKL